MQKTTGDKFRKHFSLNATGLFSGALLLAWRVGGAVRGFLCHHTMLLTLPQTFRQFGTQSPTP